MKRMRLQVVLDVTVESDYEIGQVDLDDLVAEIETDMECDVKYNTGTVRITNTSLVSVG